ncbi:MAG: extracellular solute-binding protein [Bacilli bacterium]|jgi:spermidine/putrescine transport system substrate-binding protein
MKKKFLIYSLISFSLLFASSKTSFTPALAKDDNVLRIFNWEDYIYEPEEEGEEEAIIDQFISHYKEETGVDIKVEYYTFATNEEMYNKLDLSDTQYDLLCPSDYMIQRLIREDKLEKFDYDLTTESYDLIPNYNDYGSPYLKEIFKDNEWSEYSVGYMWGTMGFVYNKNFITNVEDLSSWGVLWDKKYSHKVSIKDSMRETYLTGLLYLYQDELLSLKEDNNAALISDEDYNEKITELLNDTSEKTILEVEKVLNDLTKNIYGFEVDSGKNDIVTGKILINTAWSGDAVYSIGEAGNENLGYIIPEEATNVWFDGWVMPKGANKKLAQAFINFLSDPSVALQNVDYIGYTSFIAGEDMLDYIKDHDEYDEEGEYTVDLSYFFGDTIEDVEEAKIVTNVRDGQLTTLFPSSEEIKRAAVMKDFGEQNKRVIAMWTMIRSTQMSPALITIVIIVIVILVGFLIFNLIKRNLQYKSRKQRRKLKENS